MKMKLPMEPAICETVAARLAEATGMDPASLDANRVEWTIERRARYLKIANGAAYLAYLAGSADELADLIDTLVIQETRFFRDAAVFEQIAEWAKRTSAAANRPLRVLSAPCSTGQEAYSLAATLAHAGLSPSSFSIDAFDLSPKAIVHARAGVYPESALRHAPEGLARECGALRNHQWHMRPALRDRIQFQYRNLIEPGALGEEPRYHLILCRNLFIYLHAQARTVLANALNHALLPGGRLVIGAADRVPELEVRFAPLRPVSSLALIHKEELPESEGKAHVRAEVQGSGKVRPRQPIQRLDPTPTTAAELFSRARENYDRGNLREAERRCRQALYLAPAHLPALELLQRLWQLHPNMRLRRALRERIRRACLENGIAGAVAMTSPPKTERQSA